MKRSIPAIVLILALLAGLPYMTARPLLAAQSKSASAAELKIGAGALTLTLNPATHAYTLIDTRTSRIWRAQANPKDLKLLQARQSGPAAMEVRFKQRSRGEKFLARIGIEDNGMVNYEIQAEHPQAKFVGLEYPPRFRAGLKQGMLLFCNRAGGNEIPLNDAQFPEKNLVVYANTGALDMPWIGVVDEAQGDGVMLLFETPTEAAANLAPDEQGNHWPQAYWFDTFHQFGYTRKASYCFSPTDGYVGQTRIYRQWAESRGMVKTLKEKMKIRPKIERLCGAIDVWGANGLRFARQAQAAGVRHMLIYGQFPAADMNEMTRMGFLVGDYDCYSDLTNGPLGFDTDNVQKVAYRDEDGSCRKGWLDNASGTQFYARADSTALKAAQGIIPGILAKFPYTARFLDVHGAMTLMEDFDPAKRATRMENLQHRIDLFNYVTSLGLVLGTEHGKAWNVPYVDYTEGMTSGPFWWDTPDVGQVQPLKSLKQLSKNYWRYADNNAARVPLWELVYHDSVLTTWYWTENAGTFYNLDPKISDRKDLVNMLYGTLPETWVNNLGYNWERKGDRDRFLQTYYLTGRLNEQVGMSKMLSHRFLSEDRLLQRTRFDSGVTVTVNFSDEPRSIQNSKNESLLLAPRGYYVEGKNIEHTRQRIGGVDRAWSHLDDFWYLASAPDQPAQNGPIKAAGRIVAFKAEDNSWRLRIDHVRQAQFNPEELCGLKHDQIFRLVELDEQGRLIGELKTDPQTAWQALPDTQEARLYAILSGVDPVQPLIMPSGGEVTNRDLISMSSLAKNAVIHYTVDGSEPTARSAQYVKPFSLNDGAIVKARTFIDRHPAIFGHHPAGKINEALFTVTRELIRSGIKRGGDQPAHLEVSVDGVSQLEIHITDAGDGPSFDQTGLGDPILTDATGKQTHLEELTPLSAVQGGGVLSKNQYGGDPLVMGGRLFKNGLGTNSDARIVYALDRKYKKLELWAGILDRTNPKNTPGVKNGSIEAILTGISKVK